MHIDNQIFASVETFAQITDLSSRSIWRLIKANRVPSLRVGGRRLVPVAEGIDAIKKIGATRIGPAAESPEARS